MPPDYSDWASTSETQMITVILSRVGFKPRCSRASIAIDQTPPPTLCTPSRLPFKSLSWRICGVAIKSPSKLLVAALTTEPGIVKALSIAGGERRHGLRAAADVDDFDIYAVLAKNSLLDAQPHGGDFFTEGAVG